MSGDHEGPWIGLSVSKEMMAELGHFVAQWGFMETYLNMMLLRLMAKPQSESEMHRLPFALSKRTSLLKETSRNLFHQYPSLVQRIDDIVTELKLIKPYREAIAHGLWSSGKEDAISIANFRNGRWSSTKLTLGKVQQLSITVSAISRRIMAIYNAGSTHWNDWAFPLPSHEIEAIQTIVYRPPLPPYPEPTPRRQRRS